MWKGFNMSIIDDETVAAAAFFVPRKDALVKELTAFCSAVHAGLPAQRRSVRAKMDELYDNASDDDTPPREPEPILLSATYFLQPKIEDEQLAVSFYCDPHAASVKDLSLWIEFSSRDPGLRRAATHRRWSDPNVATRLFGSNSSIEIEGGWVSGRTKIATADWLETAGTSRAVDLVRGTVSRYWDAYDQVMTDEKSSGG